MLHKLFWTDQIILSNPYRNIDTNSYVMLFIILEMLFCTYIIRALCAKFDCLKTLLLQVTHVN